MSKIYFIEISENCQVKKSAEVKDIEGFKEAMEYSASANNIKIIWQQ